MLRSLVLSLIGFACAVPLAAQEITKLVGHGGPVMAVALTAEGQPLTASFDNSAAYWRGTEPIWLEAHEAAVTTIVSIGPSRFATGGDDFAIYLWNGAVPSLLGTHRGKVRSLSVSPDGGRLASASWDGTVGLWDLTGSEVTRFQKLGSGVNDVAYASDGRLFAGTTAGEILVKEPGNPEFRIVHKQGFGVNKIILDDAGRWLAFGAVDGGTRVINSKTGEEIADFTLGRRPVLALAYHEATHRMAVGDGQGYIMVVDTKEWRIARDFQAAQTGPIWGLVFSLNGQTLWGAGMDKVLFGFPLASSVSLSAVMGQDQSYLRAPEEMSNGERQFMRKCSICHTLQGADERKAGPSLDGLFGRRAGTLVGYRYSDTLQQAEFIWTEETIDALFDLGPDHFIPGSKMPMQRIAKAQDRIDLIAFMKQATQPEN